ncbi:MAG: biotin-independent malonate decarboxylase subunit beta, partial [Pseudomonadota bacterium]
GKSVLVAAQEGGFMGGAVGEVHGAKITGLLERAQDERPAGVLLLIESGGVRLHEANAGLIAVSEIIRALVEARQAGVAVLALVGGACGCFGGMAIVARCCDAVILSEEGRLGLSGPEVIETVMGAEEFDSRDRALVWRTTGGKHRYLLGEADALVADDIAAFRAAALQHLVPKPIDARALEAEHALLAGRLERFGDCADAYEIWRRLGITDVERLPLLETEEFLAATAGRGR